MPRRRGRPSLPKIPIASTGADEAIVVALPKRKPKQKKSKARVYLANPPTQPRKSKPKMRRPARTVKPSASLTHNTMLSAILPAVSMPMRYSTVFTTTPTAVSRPFSVTSVNWSTPSADVDCLLPAGTFITILNRDALNFSFIWTLNPNFPTYSVQWYFSKPDHLDPSSYTPGQSAWFEYMVSAAPSNYPLCPYLLLDCHIGDPSYAHFHGNNWYPMQVGGRTAIYCQGTNANPWTLTVTGGTGGTPEGSGLVVYQWSGNDWTNVGRLDFTVVSGISYSSSQHGLFAFEWSSGFIGEDTPTNVRLGFVLNQSCDYFAISSLPEIGSVFTGLESLRINSMSMMFSCSSSELSASGDIVGAQLSPGVDWLSVIQNADIFSYLSEQPGARVGSFSKGMYGFHKPSKEADFDLAQIAEFNEDTVVATTSPYMARSGPLVICVKSLAPQIVDGTATYNGALGRVTVAANIEFVTHSSWYSLELPRLHPTQHINAMVRIRDAAQWHDNPMHVRDLLSYLRAGTKKALSVAPQFLTFLRAVIPGLDLPLALGEALAWAGGKL